MPITKTITTYEFTELSDKAKEAARECWRDGWMDYDWWDGVYDDAARVGLKITSFDTGRSQEINGELTDSLTNVCEAIIREHGADCDTYKTAEQYIEAYKAILAKHEIDSFDEDEDAAIEELKAEFKRAILQDYLAILGREWECLNSDACIDESIIANGAEFTEAGERA